MRYFQIIDDCIVFKVSDIDTKLDFTMEDILMEELRAAAE